MNINITCKLDLINKYIEKYNLNKKNIFEILEIFGYEINNENVSGLFDSVKDIILHPLLIILIFKNNKNIENDLQKKQINNQLINDKLTNDQLIIIEIITSKDISKYFNIYEDKKIIILKKLKDCVIEMFNILEFNYEILQNKEIKKQTFFNTLDRKLNILLINNKNNLNNKKIDLNTSKIKISLNNIIEYINNFKHVMFSFNYKEICTHPIINCEKINNINLNFKINGFLSHTYLRESIFQSFAQESEKYINFKKIFEISEIFFKEDNKIKTINNLFIAYKSKYNQKQNININLFYYDEINLIIKNLFNFFEIQNRTVNLDNNIVYIKEKKTIIIGSINYINGYKCCEINFNIIKNLVKIKNYKEEHLNIKSEENLNVIKLNLFLEDNNIQSIDFIEKYNDKYTLKIYKNY